MSRRRSFVSILMMIVAVAGLTVVPSESLAGRVEKSKKKDGGVQPHGAMLRYPDVSDSSIVFVYANDLWLVPREGGTAVPLASPPGTEEFPRFSPDGETIAFCGNYDGNRDLYTIPISGGVATRVTHHPAVETLCDWTPDDELLFFTNALAGLGRQVQLFIVNQDGGLPEKLPVPYGANGAISEDGKWLAYTPHTRDRRTWKRYRGGMATDIWLFNLKRNKSKKITDWEGTDTQPMWHGDTLYYLSDAGDEHRLNIWSYDTDSGKRKQLTDFEDYDVKWPSIGPGPDGDGEIVFQHGTELRLLDLDNGKTRVVDVTIPGDRPKIRPKAVDVKRFFQSADVSSTGKRAVIEARGDIWTLPAKNGSPRNLTRTAGVAERDPSWSPDGQWIAYFGDETGEYELYVTQSDGKGETKQLTDNGETYRYSPVWSPDSKQIAFTDKSGKLFVYSIDDEEARKIDTDPWSSPIRARWSPDSRWIVYAKGGDNRQSAIWIYDTQENETHQVTSGRFNDSWPTFDRKGDYLFFASNRDFSSPIYEDIGTTFVYANTDVLLVAPLREDIASPWAPKSDEETWGDEKDGDDAADEEEADKDSGDDEDDDEGMSDDDDDGDNDDDDGDNDDDADDDEASDDDDDDAGDDNAANDDDDDEKDKDKEDEVKAVEIDFDGLERRAIRIPVDSGNFFGLDVTDDGKLIYIRGTPRGAQGKPSIKLFDLSEDNEKKEEKTVMDGVGGYAMTADGKKLMVFKDRNLAIVNAKPDQKFDKPISMDGLNANIDPREEWRQLLREAWRIERDFFYDPNMHGVDWDGVLDQYMAMLEDCTSREDVQFVIGEMISELNVGHAYARAGGDLENQPRVSVGLLGCDYALDDGAYRISKIYEGAPWDVDARGPLSQPGVDVTEGDYLLAVNGVAIDTSKDPWAAFQDMAGKTVTITVSDKPEIDDDAREVVVELAGSEGNLRYRAWIEANRKFVAEKSDGKIGYIYVPNTGVQGQNELFRQFYGQIDADALIIDERWNGGGQIPTRFIELLNRPRTNYWAVRDGNDWPWPPDSHAGPKCMLINGLAGSGGDCFPYYFRQAGIGKLIGMRTWGGLVGISGNPQLIDSGQVTAPTFAFYETDGTWGVEGHGVDPDIEVIDDPAEMVDGGDPQLEAAIKLMKREIKKNGYEPPKRPKYPDRSGMGLEEADK